MQIAISNMQDALQVTDQLEDIVRDVINTGASLLQVSDAYEVSVAFVDSEYIRELNRLYRGKDSATDVLSFAFTEQGEGEPAFFEEEQEILGDIIISIEKAAEQAVDYGHSFEREMAFLTVHGFLHLVGYDHMEAAEAAEMEAKQKEILDKLGITR